uniref:Phosphoribosylformylglycinamidine synthase n=1 Tax=Acrobeloides nanus TaxID=290746 RepID=A0A914D486_9BILA
MCVHPYFRPYVRLYVFRTCVCSYIRTSIRAYARLSVRTCVRPSICTPIRPYVENVPKIAIVREEGSNGDREMAAAFMMAGFEAFDVTMTDLLDSINSLDSFNGIAFVGGFSYADVLGSAKGWASAIKYNKKIFSMFENFRRRKDTFTLGVCNGCQLMALLNWTSENSIGSEPEIFLDDNLCGRFHSGFTTVKIEKSPAIMLRDMDESILGVWSSHGEGRFTYRTSQVLSRLKERNLICIRYCNGEGKTTEKYPENPNGSVDGVAGICSDDGRHLCLMPHPDRSFLSWQWPNYPNNWQAHQNHQQSPWIKMFENAYEWVIQHRN